MAEWRLGILGGTFNPIHLGHLVLAEAFRERLALDRVLFVPAGTPPHKPPGGLVPALHRYAMVSLAVAGRPGSGRVPGRDRADRAVVLGRHRRSAGGRLGGRAALLPDGERHLPRPPHLADARAAGELRDARRGLPGRQRVRAGRSGGAGRARAARPDELAPRAAGRPGGARLPATCALVETRSVPVSARGVRERLAAGESVRDQVPPAVAEYIAQHGLYREPA